MGNTLCTECPINETKAVITVHETMTFITV